VFLVLLHTVALIQVRRYLLMYSTPETLLNHVFEDLRKSKAPNTRLLDCGTGAAARGNPVHGPTVSTEHISHGSVSHGRRRDGRYGQKWASSNGGRRAEVAVKSSAGSRPLLGQRESPLPRREDDAPVFRTSNGSRMRNGCPANHSSCRINSAAGQATPLAGEASDASPPP
jgi:hypothetical protein